MEVRAARLLIVDDEPQIRDMLAEFFADEGYEVVIAEDVPTALRLLSDRVDAIISDIRMPGMTGIDFLKSVRGVNPNLGVFLITGYPTLETVVDARVHGAVAYFRKPIDLDDIQRRIRAFLAIPKVAPDGASI